MNKVRVLQGVRQMRFEGLFSDWVSGRLTQAAAAQLLGVHERTFRRYCRKYEASGAEGLYDARLERISHNAAPVDEVMALLELFDTRYANFTTSHFYDRYREGHGGQRSYNWVRLT